MSQKWNEEVTQQLVDFVGNESPVTKQTVDRISETLGFTGNSIAAKLRKIGYEVASRAKSNVKTFSDAETEQLKTFVEVNSGAKTYAEIAVEFMNGKFTTKEVQGKLLSMDLTGAVKPTEKPEVVKTYTDEQEAILLEMVEDGEFVEDIAGALDKSIKSVRGKVLSLLRTNPDLKMPKQKRSYAKESLDGLESLGDVSEMTVAELAETLDKTERGVKVMLTHRGISCKDHNGEKKRAKLDAEKKAA